MNNFFIFPSMFKNISQNILNFWSESESSAVDLKRWSFFLISESWVVLKNTGFCFVLLPARSFFHPYEAMG